MQWRIHYLLKGTPTPKVGAQTQFFGENCMKMKEFRPRECARPWCPAWIRQWYQYIECYMAISKGLVYL